MYAGLNNISYTSLVPRLLRPRYEAIVIQVKYTPLPSIPFPYLVLLVSGGHCILGVVHGPGRFSRLGQSLDDSPGEAFDKVARWLCLDRHPDVSNLSGGAAIEVLAAQGDPSKFSLPHVMQRK